MKAKYRNAQIMLISWEGEYKQSAHSLRCCTLFWESLEEKNPGVIQRGCMWGGWFALCENQASFWVLQESEAGRKLLCAAWCRCRCYCIYSYGSCNRLAWASYCLWVGIAEISMENAGSGSSLGPSTNHYKLVYFMPLLLKANKWLDKTWVL